MTRCNSKAPDLFQRFFIRSAFIVFGLVTQAATAQGLDETLAARIDRLRETGRLNIADAQIAAVNLIPALYDRRGFTLAWTNPARIDDLIALIGRAPEEGLDPEDYHYTAIQRLRASPGDTTPADLDLLLTDSLTRFGYHQLLGKVDPAQLDKDWNLDRGLSKRDPVEVIQAAIDAPSLDGFVSAAVGRGIHYDRMKALLAEYREYAASGGWPTVSSGPVLKLGSEGARVATLRSRLEYTGYLEVGVSDNRDLFDEALNKAVHDYQTTQDLDVDGIVGPRTLRALNVSAEARVDQIRVNLERARWVLRDMIDVRDFMLVNIAGFRAMLVRDNEITWITRAQVGKVFRKSPIFTADMKYLVINPTWTVPPGIMAKDMLPRLRRDPGYLKRRNMRVLTHSGKTVNPASINWRTARPNSYIIRQDPGPDNALGMVKFIFPNPHFVFLHDTPHREGFQATKRAFSSGCIRIQNPFELAELLLADQGWDSDKIAEVLATGKTKTQPLSKPLPVMLLYWTLTAEGQGRMGFLNDVYERDPAVLKALKGDFKISLRDVPDWATET